MRLFRFITNIANNAYLFVVVFFLCGIKTIVPAYAGTCKLAQSTCLESVGSFCKNERRKYICIEDNYVNYCAPFERISSCRIISNTCIENDYNFGTGCMLYKQRWRCNDAVSPPPSNVVRLDDQYTLVSSRYERENSNCPSLEKNPNCQIAENRCVSTTPTPPVPPGVNPSDAAPDGCYKREEFYACIANPTQFMTEGCDSLFSDNSCTETGRRCNQYIKGQCVNETVTFDCEVPPKTSGSGSVMSCNGQMYCINGECADYSTPPDTDLVKAAATMETMREAGKYFDPNSAQFFKGEGRKCTKKLFVNCCKEGKAAQGGDGSSPWAQLAFKATSATVKWLGADYYYKLSEYTFNTLYDAGIFKDWAFDQLNNVYSNQAIAQTTGTPWQMSYYGVTLTYSSSTGFVVGFNPTLLAIQLGIQVIMNMMQCSQSDIMTSSLNKTGLCHYVGDYCSEKLPFIGCIERKDGYCCFNSKFAKLINEQGRAQLSKGWGSAKYPNCSGFTLDEFKQLDFSQIDLSPLYKEIVPDDISKYETLMKDFTTTRTQEIVNQYR